MEEPASAVLKLASFIPIIDAEKQLKSIEANSTPHLEKADQKRTINYYQNMLNDVTDLDEPDPDYKEKLSAILGRRK